MQMQMRTFRMMIAAQPTGPPNVSYGEQVTGYAVAAEGRERRSGAENMEGSLTYDVA
jgi:hypothetical protein